MLNLALLFLALSTDSHAFGRKAPVIPQPDIPAPTVSLSPAPSGQHILFKCATCNTSEVTKVAKAQVKANEVVASQCFSDFMLSWGLINTNGRTPAQVVEHLRTTTKTIPIHYYYSLTSTVGYTYASAPDVYMNRKFHNSYSICETASNGTHEWAHQLKYYHPAQRTSNRGQTVPYGINNAFTKCCR